MISVYLSKIINHKSHYVVVMLHNLRFNIVRLRFSKKIRNGLKPIRRGKSFAIESNDKNERQSTVWYCLIEKIVCQTK